MALITVLWALVGYSLCFGEGTPVIGGFSYALLRGVGADPNADYAGTIPHQTFMVYQLMFAIITPALITGATAERMKFSGMVRLHDAVVAAASTAPLAHMVWGKGGLLNAALGGRFPTLDFAGGTVVHITSGVSALVCALYLGKRTGYPKEPMPPHSLVLSFIGACLLWVGWFGFNAGSALASNGLATSAFVATHFAAAAATIGWLRGRVDRRAAGRARWARSRARSPDWWRSRRRQGSSTPMPAMLIGLVAGVGCFLMVTFVKGTVRLRRCAGRVRRARRGRHDRRAADGRLRDALDQRRSSTMRRASRCRSAGSTATRRRSVISSWASRWRGPSRWSAPRAAEDHRSPRRRARERGAGDRRPRPDRARRGERTTSRCDQGSKVLGFLSSRVLGFSGF